jgi:hypothetical protein
MRKVVVLLALLMLSSCTTERRWFKTGSTRQDFNQDRYRCMQESQQRVSSAYVNQYGGSSNSGVRTNRNLFNACMEAQGWELREVHNR